MKNGFTLIELLIVMIIVSTLVAIALPKYQRSLERGRALEGLRNVQYVAEYVAAKHMATGSWPTNINDFKKTDIVKSRFFGAPQYDSDTPNTITISRTGDWNYTLTATISNDALSSITCSDSDDGETCESLDLTGNLMTR